MNQSAEDMRDLRLIPQVSQKHTVSVWCCECLQDRPNNHRLITDVKIPQRDIHRYCDDKFHMQQSIEIPIIFSGKVGESLVKLLTSGDGRALDLGPEEYAQLLQVLSYLGVEAG